MRDRTCADLYEIVKIVEQQTAQGEVDLEAVRKHLNSEMKIRVVPKGMAIARKENAGRFVYYILKGTYFHYRISKKGRMDFLSNEKAPQWMDIGNIIAAQYANDTEDKTLGECVVLDIKGDYFVRCVMESGEFAMKIIENILIKMAKISCESDKRLLSDCRERLLLYILECWNESGEDSGICEIDRKNEDIADIVGISIRTFYRILKELKEKEMIDVKKGKIYVNGSQIEMIRQTFEGPESNIQETGRIWK